MPILLIEDDMILAGFIGTGLREWNVLPRSATMGTRGLAERVERNRALLAESIGQCLVTRSIR